MNSRRDVFGFGSFVIARSPLRRSQWVAPIRDGASSSQSPAAARAALILALATQCRHRGHRFIGKPMPRKQDERWSTSACPSRAYFHFEINTADKFESVR
jgi:hypothetical protein